MTGEVIIGFWAVLFGAKLSRANKSIAFREGAMSALPVSAREWSFGSCDLILQRQISVNGDTHL